MQSNILNIMIAVLISALLGYGFWSIGGVLSNYLAIGSFLFLSGTLVPSIGLSSTSVRLAVNQKVLAGTFFVIGLLINTAFALFATSSVFYVLLSAIAYLIFIIIANWLQNTSVH